ncbi:MAG: MarR family winged helix-turn-helix transcriptional regulator [Streptosporangiaceae bacterium]
MNVPGETIIRAAARANAAPGRAEMQNEIIELLRDVVRGFRRQHVQLAVSEQFPFPVYGVSLAAVREISEHPGITVNELARLTGLPKSRVSVLMTRLAAQRIVRKDSDEHDGRLVRLHITPEGRQCVAAWTVAGQRAIGALLQPLGDDELDIIARGLAALQRAFRRAQEQGTAGHAGSPPPC